MIKRTEKEQQEVDKQCEKLSLYEMGYCPFCIKVRQVVADLGLNIKSCDTQESLKFMKELFKNGGKTTVPCLKIKSEDGVNWLYESNDIIKYLKNNFA